MFYYLASPYTHVKPKVRALRYQQAMAATRLLLLDNHTIYSPIVHCHVLAMTYDLPLDEAWWARHNYDMLDVSKALIVLRLDEWRKSHGIRNEISRAMHEDKPIYYTDPNEPSIKELAEELHGVHP